MSDGEAEPGAGAPAPRRRWVLAIPVVLAIVVHAAAAGNGFTNWDDPGYLLHNPLVLAPLADGLTGLLLTADIGYSIPLTVLLYAGEHALFGFEPAGYHAVSVALHALVVLAAAALARRLGAGYLAAAGAAALFAVHPLVVEPVAWVVGQKDLLAALLLLAALWVRAADRGAEPGAAAACAALVLASLAAKPNTVAAPLLLLGIDAVRGRRLARPGHLALYGITAAMAAAATALALWGHSDGGGGPAQRIGAGSLAEAAWALLVQARHIFWPHPLTARYFAPEGATLWLGAAGGAAVAALALAGIVTAWRRGHRAIAFGAGAALLAYAPASGLVPLTRGAADSYLYLPLALAVTAGAAALARVPRRRGRQVAAALAIACAVLGWKSRAQIGVWRDAPSLWGNLAEAYPDEPRALVRLADAYLFEGQVRRALAIYEHVRAQHPDFTAGSIGHGDALELSGRTAEAEAVLAEGARRGDHPLYGERYGFFLIGHPALAPSDDEAARAALVQIAPLLAERGKRPVSLQRAAELLEGYGERRWAEALRRRIEALRRRAAD